MLFERCIEQRGTSFLAEDGASGCPGLETHDETVSTSEPDASLSVESTSDSTDVSAEDVDALLRDLDGSLLFLGEERPEDVDRVCCVTEHVAFPTRRQPSAPTSHAAPSMALGVSGIAGQLPGPHLPPAECMKYKAKGVAWIARWVQNMFNEWTGRIVSLQTKVLSLFNCMGCEDTKKVVRQNLGGWERVDAYFRGKEAAVLGAWKMSCGLGGATSDTESGLTDKSIREWIAISSCETIAGRPFEELEKQAKQLFSGFLTSEHSVLGVTLTGDDERTMAKLFTCITCDVMKRLTDALGGWDDVLRRFGGEHLTTMKATGFSCGLVDITELGEPDIRLLLETRNCAQLETLDDDSLSVLLKGVLHGSMSNVDERTIVKLVGCLPCARLKTILGLVGGLGRVENVMSGPERDQLLALTHKCGVEGAGVDKLDDNSARLVLTSSACSDLEKKDVHELQSIIMLLLRGWTGGADQMALLKLLGCMSCPKLKDIVNGIGGVEVVHRDVGGETWDKLQVMWVKCDLIPVTSLSEKSLKLVSQTPEDCLWVGSRSPGEIASMCRRLLTKEASDCISLLLCLEKEKLKAVLREPGMITELKTKVSGKDWEDLSALLKE